MKKKALMKVIELADFIGVNKYRIYEWVRHNSIPHLKTFGGIRFDPEEIEIWLRRHREGKEIAK